MPLDTQDDAWKQGNEESKSTDNSTGVSTDALIDVMAEIDAGKAYSSKELYIEITGEEPDEDDLKAFVPIWAQMTKKSEDGLYQKHKDKLPEGMTIERKKVDEDAGYEGWYFALVEA